MGPSGQVRNVLIYRVGSLGDTVVALPALWSVRKRFADARITVLSNLPTGGDPKQAPLRAILPIPALADAFLDYAADARGWRVAVDLARAVRRLRPDILVYLMPPRSIRQRARDWVFFRWVCGISRIVGLRFGGDSQRHRRLGRALGECELEAVRLLRLVGLRTEGDALDSPCFDLLLSPTERAAAARALAVWGAGTPYIVCAPGTKMPAKDWGEERWSAWASGCGDLAERYRLVLIGAADESARADRIAGAWLGRALNLCGQLSPRESAAVIAGAELFVGNDSGPMHLADALDVPIVAVFSAHERAGIWFPWRAPNRVLRHDVPCAGCRLQVCPVRGHPCVSGIDVDDVLAATREMMAWVINEHDRGGQSLPRDACGARAAAAQAYGSAAGAGLVRS
jgi:heptosyltransferase-3